MENKKIHQLKKNVVDNSEKALTTNDGVEIADNNNTLKAGTQGPLILSDQVYLEKLMHFDRERIPERVVHARGAGAHGIFEAIEDISEYTTCKFLKKGTKTPVFTRFSIVGGSKGASDLARDVRGFAVKFYTQEGNFDLVGNNIPVFFIQDPINFPDLIHAQKPEPNTEIPQASSAHDTFWDFVSLMPETAHCLLWLMSDRALPRSYRMMEGFGVHTFKFLNDKQEYTYVKFHWKPKLGVQSITWDEAQKLSGFDPDFHRRDLWENIEKGNFPQWELGVQLISEMDSKNLPFNILDPTKLVPEEIIPVKTIGIMTLNKNPENVFAETEQIAFDPGRLVPGIDLSEDPLLQGRVFSYMDTQNYRLGGANFQELPINRALNQKHNNQADGASRQDIIKGNVNYFPNSINGGCPYHVIMGEKAFKNHEYNITGNLERKRPPLFEDHFSQAKLFYNSQSEVEKQHIISAFSFELTKVKRENIRQRTLDVLSQVDLILANKVGLNLNLSPNKGLDPLTIKYAKEIYDIYPPKEPIPSSDLGTSKFLSIIKSPYKSYNISTKKIAFLITPFANMRSIQEMHNILKKQNAAIDFLSSMVGNIKVGDSKEILNITHTPTSSPSVGYDAIFIPNFDSEKHIDTLKEAQFIHFIHESYKHCKPICIEGRSNLLFKHTQLKIDKGIIKGEGVNLHTQFIELIKKGRVWELESERNIPA